MSDKSFHLQLNGNFYLVWKMCDLKNIFIHKEYICVFVTDIEYSMKFCECELNTFLGLELLAVAFESYKVKFMIVSAL